VLTVKQVADRLGVRPATVRAWIFRRENLDFVKVGRSVRISEETVEEFINSNMRRVLTPAKAGDSYLSGAVQGDHV
jgi:excisionase family DNA binding protein